MGYSSHVSDYANIVLVRPLLVAPVSTPVSTASLLMMSGHYDTGQQHQSGQSGGKHLAILKWLQAIQMEHYVTMFHQYGGVEVSCLSL